MSDFWGRQYTPASTKLGRYRLLSPNAGVHVSPIQLGTMNMGGKWDEYLGPMDKDASFKLLDAYYDAGGNFIDTSSEYQDGKSEECVGEWVEKRGIRDQLVIATKYTANFKRRIPDVTQKVLFAGNGNKSLRLSVEDSLRKLRVTYIDILYLHYWDYCTSIEEVMSSLHALVMSGKVLYLGISNSPAWVVAKANQYARDHAMTPFVIYQGIWNVMERDFERDIIPMARSEGMALAPFSVLAGGKFRTDAEEARRREACDYRKVLPVWERDEKEKKVSEALEKVAREVGAKHITAVAIAYVMQKAPYVFPVLGGRKVEHLMANLEALDITLTDDHIRELESVVELDLGFPAKYIGTGTDYVFQFSTAAEYEKPLLVQPAKPQREQ